MAFSKNKVIEAVFLQYIDDVYDVLPNILKEFSNDLKNKFRDLNIKIFNIIEDLKKENFPTKKSYALFVQKNIDKKFHSFFFNYSNDFISKNTSNSLEAFQFWIGQNFKKIDWH